MPLSPRDFDWRASASSFELSLNLQKVPLAITDDGDLFKINDAAAVSVMIYRGRKVKVNYSLPEDGLDLRTISKIVKSTKEMLNEPVESPKASGKVKPREEPQ